MNWLRVAEIALGVAFGLPVGGFLLAIAVWLIDRHFKVRGRLKFEAKMEEEEY